MKTFVILDFQTTSTAKETVPLAGKNFLSRSPVAPQPVKPCPDPWQNDCTFALVTHWTLPTCSEYGHQENVGGGKTTENFPVDFLPVGNPAQEPNLQQSFIHMTCYCQLFFLRCVELP